MLHFFFVIGPVEILGGFGLPSGAEWVSDPVNAAVNIAAAPIHATETLHKRGPRRYVGDHQVRIDVQARFDDLSGDEDSFEAALVSKKRIRALLTFIGAESRMHEQQVVDLELREFVPSLLALGLRCLRSRALASPAGAFR